MEALIRYALWVKRHLVQGPAEPSEDQVGLEQMPEVREVLEIHLDPTRDASPAIRSIYGRWLPTLVYVDREWVKKNLRKIFPTDATLAHFRDAAWDT
jgi:hypothetical protein